MRLLFHGTSHTIKDLAFAHVGKGGDSNSALGFHTADSPYVAADYAEISSKRDFNAQQGRVLAILASDTKSFIETSHDDFFGLDDNGDCCKDHNYFSAWREDLLGQGYQLFEVDGYDESIVVILNPASDAFKIVAELSPDEAIKLEDAYDDEGLSYDDTERRVVLLKELIRDREVEPTSSMGMSV